MKFLDDIIIQQTGSIPDAPSSTNYGIIYASSSALHYRNTTSITTLGQTNSRINILQYTGSRTAVQTYTYTVPSSLVLAEIICVGAGGGGGSGRASAVATVTTIGTRQGGCGGAGGTIVRAFYTINELGGAGNTHTVTVGMGGAGGAGTGSANGNPGSNGQATSFGSLVIAAGGQGGQGGTTGTPRIATSSSLINSFPANYLHATIAQPGSISGTTGVTTTPDAALTRPYGTGAGGSGGGYGNIAGAGREASSGSSAYFATSTSSVTTIRTNTGSPGALKIDGTPGGNGSAGTDNLSLGLWHFNGSLLTYGLGGGGHGGGYPTGSGGNAGLYGTGGGGGAAGWSSTHRSGAGGSGSAGLCIVIEYL